MIYTEEGNMFITLNDKELTDALVKYVSDKHGLNSDNEFLISLKAGRATKKKPVATNTATIAVIKKFNPNAPVQLELPLSTAVEISKETLAESDTNTKVKEESLFLWPTNAEKQGGEEEEIGQLNSEQSYLDDELEDKEDIKQLNENPLFL